MKGDFTGFTFVYGGKAYTTEDLGITRVSDGDRYNEPLIPEIEDKTIEIPGLDGSYFYGSDFKARNFSIKIAYDEMNEVQFRKMRQVFGYKHIGLLIFDEAPYKQYRVKIASPPELDFVCFDERSRQEGETVPNGGITWHTEEVQQPIVDDEGEPVMNDDDTPAMETVQVRVRDDITPWKYNEGTQRIYKGEGSIEFIAYYPFATQTHKFLDDFGQTNVNEWSAASRLLTKESANLYAIDKVLKAEDSQVNPEIHVYNAGDVPTGFMIWIPFKQNIGEEKPSTNWDKNLQLDYNNYSLIISKDIQPQSSRDKGIIINTVNGLVEGVETVAAKLDGNIEYSTSGTVYNRYVKGYFFKIEPTTEYDTIYISSMPSMFSESFFPIINPTGNPSEQGWYEYDEEHEEYNQTEDTEVVEGKTYYQQGNIHIFYNYLYF